jgi:hypothetical protein
MVETELIDVLLRQLQGICANCIKFENCSYRKTSSKVIIQCELFEQGEEIYETNELKGLCATCCNNACSLPDKQFGVWHCEAYKS